MTRIEEAVDLFDNGYVCSQAVFAVLCEEFGLSKSDAFKIGACFGSGMRQAEVCGACTGALMAIGLKHGDDKEVCNELSNRFFSQFKKENGSFICRDLLECDISTPEGVEKARNNNLFKEICPKWLLQPLRLQKKLYD